MTSIKVDGVLHEFTTIPGVKEDVVELVMNVKDLCVSSEHDEPVSMIIDFLHFTPSLVWRTRTSIWHSTKKFTIYAERS